MRLAVINGTRINSMEKVHDCLQRQLGFPGYYGKNLDALYDLLSTEDRPTLLLLFDSKGLAERLGSKGQGLVETLQDAALQNHRLRLVCVRR